MLDRMSHTRKIGIAAACGVALIAVLAAFGSAGGSTHAMPPAAQRFTLHALGHTGQEVSLAQYQGRPVMVNFFASWCTPCKKETPLLAGFYRAHHGQIAIVGVDVNDSTTAALKFAHLADVEYPVGTDPTGATATRYGVVAIPQTFFLDAGHRIVKRVFGAVTMTELKAGLAAMH
jgi:cytochrome c biogenesis protein CcmG, thiol:disulfide interchange protein DsbE